MPTIDDVRNMANQIQFNKTKAEDELPKIKWGPTVYAKDWSGHDLSNIMHDALTWATEHSVRISETQVIPIGGWYHLKVWYKPDERIEDSNGEPCWLSDL